MNYTFYTNSVAAFDGMQEALRVAITSIYWESYIFIDDVATHRFLDLLKEKATQGVSVKIVLDSVGSFQFFNAMQRDLASCGIELLFFNPLLPWRNPYRLRRWWFLRTHRKLLIIDGRVGFIGGVNIGKHYAGWHDLHLRLEGVFVRRFVVSFARSYRLSGGRDRLLLPSRNNVDPASFMNILFLDHSPFGGRSYLRRVYKAHCMAATRRIVIVTPYFVPHRWLMRALQRAIRRGVAVEVIMPKTTDSRLLNLANAVCRELGARRGIMFFLFPEMIHAKALLVDDREGIVGSNNIDALSFDYNLEASVSFSDEHMVGDLRTIIETWKQASTRYYPHAKKKSWYERALILLVKLLQPIL
mgnify:CR=1 FL=1